MQQSTNDFFTDKSAEKRMHNEMESTTEDKDGDNSDNLSDQDNNETCTFTKEPKRPKNFQEGMKEFMWP